MSHRHRDMAKSRETLMNRTRMFALSALGTIALASLIGTIVQAQSDAPPPPGRDVFFMRMGGGPMGPDDAIGFVGFESEFGGKTVTGAPFSATISTQTTQVLADGNHINRTTTGTIARDTQGRTRRDMTLPIIGEWGTSGSAAPHVVFIDDSVAGTRYILQPDKKIARKMASSGKGKHGGEGGEQGDVVYGAGARSKGRNVATTSLGTQTINGVLAEGTRTTLTIPAGAVGNAHPIVITNERWYSPELQTIVMSKRSDPFNGETTFQLTNIQKQEPDASLFQVPSDYTVRQGGVGARRYQRGQIPPPLPAPDEQ